MSGFYGRTYRYRGKTIGVCNASYANTYMIGFTESGYANVRIIDKELPLFFNVTEAQRKLDEYAVKHSLVESRS